jgi:hypothetical protein
MKKTSASLLVLLSVGCASTVRLGQLLADPGHYDGKTVTTSGTVARSASVLNYGTYEISDGTGKITVVTTSGGAPRDNTRVAVTGKFHAAFTLGTKSLAVLEESSRRPIGP